MKIVCPNCLTSVDLEDGTLKVGGFSCCTACHKSFRVHKTAARSAPGDLDGSAGRSSWSARLGQAFKPSRGKMKRPSAHEAHVAAGKILYRHVPLSRRGDRHRLARMHKPWLAALLSFFVPGLGQFYNGHLAKGFFFFHVWIAWIFLLIAVLPHAPAMLSALAESCHAGPGITSCLANETLVPILSTLVFFTYLAWPVSDAYHSAKKIHHPDPPHPNVHDVITVADHHDRTSPPPMPLAP